MSPSKPKNVQVREAEALGPLWHSRCSLTRLLERDFSISIFTSLHFYLPTLGRELVPSRNVLASFFELIFLWQWSALKPWKEEVERGVWPEGALPFFNKLLRAQEFSRVKNFGLSLLQTKCISEIPHRQLHKKKKDKPADQIWKIFMFPISDRVPIASVLFVYLCDGYSK